MVMKMNKTKFVMELSNQLSYSNDKCMIINDILENNFFISKKNKDNIVGKFIDKLSISKEEAMKIYDVAIGIIESEIKNKVKHPFKNHD